MPMSKLRSISRLKLPSDVAFAFGTSLLWLALYNVRFWHQSIAAMWSPSLSASAFIVSLFVLVLTLQASLLLIMPTRALMRTAASGLFIVAALGSWFTQTYGAVMNKEMLRNVFETDAAEIGGLVNPDLVLYLILFGVVPALLAWNVQWPDRHWSIQLRQRALFGLGALSLSAFGLLGCSANYAVYFREYKPIRYTLSPAAPVVSAIALLARENDARVGRVLQNPGGESHRTGRSELKPLVLFIVVGETARAANFQLYGYARPTNPSLSRIDNLIVFSKTSSCGTSTSISVPCMFSHFGRDAFDADEAYRYTNVLDALMQAGLDVEWRENNAGCKGVCERVPTISYAQTSDPHLCRNGYCYDGIMLRDLDARLQHITRDTIIVFHQIGSHGPAYSERYPPEIEKFRPACHDHELQHCTSQEVINAYDNTIVYTDSLLSKQILLLEQFSDRLDGALIYASDHGESLGEEGVYLHGMPYTFAPRVQKEVPLFMWFSLGYLQRMHLDLDCMRARSSAPASHDHLYHTILGATQVRNDAYRPELDLVSRCRRPELQVSRVFAEHRAT